MDSGLDCVLEYGLTFGLKWQVVMTASEWYYLSIVMCTGLKLIGQIYLFEILIHAYIVVVIKFKQ